MSMSGLFDFNGDGSTDLGEEWIAFNIFEDTMKTDAADDCLFDDDADDDSWREFAEDSSEYGIDPEDYETEEEYEEALEEAKYGWRDTAEDGSEYGIDPEDYETEEEYEEALEEARSSTDIPVFVNVESQGDGYLNVNESDYPNRRMYQAAYRLAGGPAIYIGTDCGKSVKERCRFILEKHDEILAADYLTVNGDFLFSQAVKDNFDLPLTLPDEDERSEFSLREILVKIQKKDVSLALKVWDWCLEQFLPYERYAPFSRGIMTNNLLDDLYYFTDEFRAALREYLNSHADFRSKLIRQSAEMPQNLGELTVRMIRDGYTETAKAVFDDGLYRAEGKWRDVNNLMDQIINYARDNKELETAEFVEENFLPRMKEYSDGMILDEIEGWQKDITEYKRHVERYSKKYAYSRSNAWRKKVPDGSRYGLYPINYGSEREYTEALQKAKYAWRERAAARDTAGLDPNLFETEAEYNKALHAEYERRRAEKREERNRREALLREQAARCQPAEKAEFSEDKTIYTYCGVKLPFSARPYSFRTDDKDLKIGDKVTVPVGEDNREAEGIVVSLGQYARIGVPYPVEKTKFILRKTGK